VKKLTFLVLCLEGIAVSFNVAASSALIPSIASHFQVTEFAAGKMTWLYMLPYGVAALFYGPLARAFDAKKIEVIFFSLFSLANIFCAFSKDIYFFFASRFLTGLFGSCITPLTLILIANQVDSTKRGKYVGVFFSATFLSSLAGLFLSGFIHWRLIYLIPGFAGLIIALLVYGFLPSFKPPMKEKISNYRAALSDRRILQIFAYIFLVSVFYHGIQQWLGVYFARDFAFGQLTISMLITLTSFSGIFGEAIGGVMSDKFGRTKTIKIGTALMIFSVAALIFKPNLYTLIFIMIAWGLGWTFNHVGLSTILTDLPKKFVNESASLNSGVRFLAGGLGALVGGLLMQKSFTFGLSIFGLMLFGLLFVEDFLLKAKGA